MAALFRLRVKYFSGHPVILISGEITSEAEDELVKHYGEIRREDKSTVIIDFSSTKYINSAGIAILIGLITKATDNKIKIEFSGLNPHYRKVMDIVGLTDFVQIHDTLQDALEFIELPILKVQCPISQCGGSLLLVKIEDPFQETSLRCQTCQTWMNLIHRKSIPSGSSYYVRIIIFGAYQSENVTVSLNSDANNFEAWYYVRTEFRFDLIKMDVYQKVAQTIPRGAPIIFDLRQLSHVTVPALEALIKLRQQERIENSAILMDRLPPDYSGISAESIVFSEEDAVLSIKSGGTCAPILLNFTEQN